jgi:hypothetical protein
MKIKRSVPIPAMAAGEIERAGSTALLSAGGTRAGRGAIGG